MDTYLSEYNERSVKSQQARNAPPFHKPITVQQKRWRGACPTYVWRAKFKIVALLVD